MPEQSETERVEFELATSLLAELDDRYEDLGYPSREALLKDAVTDAIAHPEFDRGDLRAMLTGEVDIQAGRFLTSAEVTADVDTGRPDVDSNDWDWAMTETARTDLDRRDDYARERIVNRLDEIVSGEWRNPTENLDGLADAPHDKLLVGPFRLGCRVDQDEQLLYVLRIRMRGS